jgi:hypothetical protein
MPTVYVETSIVSHASARLSSDPVLWTLQTQAKQWWFRMRPRFDLMASELVVLEASAGDPDAAAERLRLLDGIPLVPIDSAVQKIADALVSHALMPEKAAADALHVAAAASAGVEYLLTQNCRHIANAHMLPRVYAALKSLGVSPPLICTPVEFLGDLNDDAESNS